MPTIRIEPYEDSLVLHFRGEFSTVNAHTLAESLDGIADAARVANSFVNPDFEIEILVEALGPGSFKAKLRAKYKSHKKKVPGMVATIILSIIANVITQKVILPEPHVEVHVGDQEVIVEQGDMRVVVPRRLHEATRVVEGNPAFERGIRRVFDALDADEAVTAIGFSREMADREPDVTLPRARFAPHTTRGRYPESDMPHLPDAALPAEGVGEVPTVRQSEVTVRLRIFVAILEPSTRKWWFYWQDRKMSARMKDETFFDRFASREFTIAPGDTFRVRLSIREVLHVESGRFVHDPKGYEVLEVLDHLPGGGRVRLMPR